MTHKQIIKDIIHSHCELDLTDEQASAIWAESRKELEQMNATVILDQMDKNDGPDSNMAENILLEIALSTPSFQATHLNAVSFIP